MSCRARTQRERGWGRALLTSMLTSMLMSLLVSLSTLMCVGCGERVTAQRGAHVRLSRAWHPLAWESIGALDRRGPLTVGIWRPRDFKRWSLAPGAWVTPEVAQALDLSVTQDLRGASLVRSQALSLDGLQKPLSLDLYLLPSAGLQALPPQLDVIISSDLLARHLSARTPKLKAHPSGHLSSPDDPNSEQPKREHTSLSETQEARSDSLTSTKGDEVPDTPAHLQRFKRWSPRAAYPDLIVGTQVDEVTQTVMRWRRPLTSLPPDLWLLVDLTLSPDQHMILGAWIIKSSGDRDIIQRSTVSTWTLGDTERRRRAQPGWRSTCTYAAPCPVTLRDVIRRIERCTHDLCVYKAHSSFSLSPAQ